MKNNNHNNKKILIIRFGALGDVVETTALTKALKQENFEVHYLTSKSASIILKYNNNVDKVWIFEKKNYSYVFNLASQFRKEKYYAICNLHPSIRTKILSILSMPKKNLTYKKSYKFHAVENFFYTAKPILNAKLPDKNIKIYPDVALQNKMQTLLDNKSIKICFNIGATDFRQGRKWKIEYWTELSKLIFDKFDAEIFINGSKDDLPRIKKLLESEPRLKTFAGQLSLEESIALMSLADIMISGDTGPLHIASALEKPVCIGLYGSCSPSRSGPYGEKHFFCQANLPCVPCDKKKCKFLSANDNDNTPCMETITPEIVFEKTKQVIKSLTTNLPE